MELFKPHLEILAAPQRTLWEELHATPEHFTLYGGTALALQIGHRDSADFDFFSRRPFEPQELMRSLPYLEGAETLDVAKNTLTCSVDRDGKIKMQFFGGTSLNLVAPRLQPHGAGFWVASLLDVAGTKVKVLPERAAARDYIDIDALLRHGIDLPTMLAAGKAIYGSVYNPLLSLKALSYFEDVPEVPNDARKRLRDAALSVELSKLPKLKLITEATPKGNSP